MDGAAVRESLLNDEIVSRETIARLDIYADQIAKWNPRINLVAKNSMPDLWFRHFYDSLQIIPHLTLTAQSWLDVGSGGGFPALVLATHFTETDFTLVESDQRKSAFLRQTARLMGLDRVIIVDDRIEQLPDANFEVISARALADLSQLFDWLARFGNSGGLFIFPKGKNWQSELTGAEENWQYQCESVTSRTDIEARILFIKEVMKR